MLGAPREEVAIFGNRRVNQLIDDVIGRVADETRIEHERVAIGFLQTRDMAYGPDTIRPRTAIA